MRLLVIEDKSLAAESLWRALREAGYVVELVHDGELGLARLLADPYDAAIIDFAPPGRSGISVVQSVRAEGHMLPILMLTAKDGADYIKALDAGVDDYLTKPYSVDDLLARVRALLRRRKSTATTALMLGDVVVDRLKREVQVRGRPVRVTPREFALLEQLFLNSGVVVTRTVLLEKVWDIHYDPTSNVVDVHVGRLRSKLRRHGASVALETVRGAGYRIRAMA